jgi:NADPH:quinone reductase-like Zn-dependent oxidoreductase
MPEMKAMEFTDKLNLQPVTRPAPQPKAGDILIQVYATGGTRTEKLCHYADGSTRSKAMPGHEFSGIVAGLAILADEPCR